MKKNNASLNFGEPTRQSIVAILLIIWKTYRIIVRQVWPFILLFLFKQGGLSTKNHFVMGIIAFALLGMVYSIVNYFRYYFYIENDELIIESGVFKRSKLNVPFDRIQTINFEQNIIHRLFNVVRLKVDTAGSAKAEFEFHALANDKAEALRDFVLSNKKHVSLPEESSENESSIEETPIYKTILRLDLGDLIKAGAVENHLRSSGIILAFMYWIYQSIDDLGMYRKVEETVSSQLSGGLVLAIMLMVMFMILSFVVSMVKMIFTNYDLKFMRSENGFKINSGLFTKKDTSALDHKIQVISWGDNPLKKLIGIKDLRLKQASSIVLNKKTSIKIPSCTEKHITQVTDTLYGKNALDNISYQKVDKRYFYRNGAILATIFIAIVALFLYGQHYKQAVIFGIIGFVVTLTFYLKYKKKRYGYNNEMLVIRGGSYGDKTEVLPIYKIQSLSRKQTPYQRRNGLASLLIHTASGKVGIPYIKDNVARQIMDVFLYKVEKDKRKWM